MEPSPRAAQGFRVDVVEDRQQVQLLAVGELDLVTAPVLQRHVDLAVQRGRPSVILDLGGVTFVDVRGVHALVAAEAAARRAGADVVVRGCGPRLRRTIALCGLEDQLRFE